MTRALIIRLGSDGWWAEGRRLAARDEALLVGRDLGCGLVLESPAVSRLHVRLLRAGPASALAEDLKSSQGTRLNGRRITGPTELRQGDRLELPGATLTLTCGPQDGLDPEEQNALAAIAAEPRTSTLRLVYADWLEGRGDRVRAEFVRAQVALHRLTPSASQFAEHAQRLERLSAQVPRAWAEALAVVAIANCGGQPRAVPFEFLCSQAWDSLQPTGHETTRRCPVCAKTVTLVDDSEQLARLASAGQCVAVRPVEAPAPRPHFVGRVARPP